MMSGERDQEFEGWYSANYSRVLAAVHIVCGDSALAEDATHTACVRALEKWSSVREMRSPTGWVVRVGINAAKRSQSRRIRGRVLERNLTQPSSTLDRHADHELWDRVGQLPKRQREAIVLRYVDDLEQKDVASVLEIAPGTAAASLHQARASLRSSQLFEGNDGTTG